MRIFYFANPDDNSIVTFYANHDGDLLYTRREAEDDRGSISAEVHIHDDGDEELGYLRAKAQRLYDESLTQ